MDRRLFLATAALIAAHPLVARAASGTVATGGLAERLALYAATLTYDDLDDHTVTTIKGHLIDTIGCAMAALEEKPVQVARRVALAARATDRAKGATVWGTRRKTTPELAAFANGCAIRQLDLNDIYIGKEIGHPSDNIAACMAVAESCQANGRDLILAIAIAYEINCRLMDAAQINTLGWDHTNFDLPAVALAAGRLMHLDQAQLVEAVNLSINAHLALNQTRIQTISNWKGMAAAEAGRDAIFATTLASQGLTGPSPIFEGNAGFFRKVSGALAIDTAGFGGRGNPFRIADCSIKFYPAQGLTQTAIVAAIDVARQVGDLGRITAVEIRTSEDGVDKSGRDPQKWAPETSETADHSLPYIVARAMKDGDIGVHSYELELVRDPALRTFMQKITVVADPELTAIYPKYYATIVTATLTDGSKVSKRVDDIPGLATHPMQKPDFEAKFRKYAGSHLSASQMDQVLRLVWRLDASDSVEPLLAALVQQHAKGAEAE